MKYLYLLITVLVIACGSERDSSHSKWEGEWKAEWQTDPSGYPEVSGELDFTMEGKFVFVSDSITIIGYGYKGCIFSEDTIKHTLIWKVSNDSLMLYNDEKSPGLTYKITQSDESAIKLQLEDIYVSLNK
ncbi:unnamed protein product [Chrysoparadoxa australica]